MFNDQNRPFRTQRFLCLEFFILVIVICLLFVIWYLEFRSAVICIKSIS
jgi:hypothetical protein